MHRQIASVLSLLLCIALLMGTFAGCTDTAPATSDTPESTVDTSAPASSDEAESDEASAAPSESDTATDATTQASSGSTAASQSSTTGSRPTGNNGTGTKPTGTVVTTTVATTSSVTVPKNTKPLGSFLILGTTHGIMLDSTVLTAEWTEANNAETYTLVVEEYKDGAFAPCKEFTGITALSYKVKTLKAGTVYRWNVYAVNSAGTRVANGINDEEGNIFMTVVDAKNHPANKGLDFAFDGSISKEVLCNYLGRAMTVADGLNGSPLYGSNATEGTPEFVMCNIRMILNTGVKYVGRAGCNWSPSLAAIEDLVNVKGYIDYAHSIDPDIVFEACIFECIGQSVNEIAIPAWVFEAFGLTPENRNFRFDKMRFPDGTYLNQWGNGTSVPDITQQETQMFFYFLACSYIDAGFEALHMGQVHLIGRNDSGWKCYTKLNTMIRDYAKKNARRHMVLINSHTHGITDANGKLMFDFHAWPMRAKVPEGSVAHVPTEDNPQKLVLEVGYSDAIYKKSAGGTTYSGWSCTSLPYVVEIDNYGATSGPHLNQPSSSHWGYDEISWFNSQPASYRREWLAYAYVWLNETDPVGHFMMPGVRVAYESVGDSSVILAPYHNYVPLFHSKGKGDEETIRNIFIYSR
ncbi:MAG: hypothetical protein IJZ13_01505 [Clostridia bacterium]|nr:hypothetical protein [Clostridia bacterium]